MMTPGDENYFQRPKLVKKPRKTLRRGGRINPISKRRRVEGAEYAKKRKAFLAAKPWCERCKLQRSGTVRRSSEVHHTRGRRGGNYLSEITWMAVCKVCHREIHDRPKSARQAGQLF